MPQFGCHRIEIRNRLIKSGMTFDTPLLSAGYFHMYASKTCAGNRVHGTVTALAKVGEMFMVLDKTGHMAPSSNPLSE